MYNAEENIFLILYPGYGWESFCIFVPSVPSSLSHGGGGKKENKVAENYLGKVS